MPSRNALQKAAESFRRLAEEQGPEVAMEALNRRGNQLSEVQYQQALQIIEEAKAKRMRGGGYIPMKGYQFGGTVLPYNKEEEDEKRRIMMLQQQQAQGPLGTPSRGGGLKQRLAERVLSSILPFQDGGMVPQIDYGPDPLGLEDGTNKVRKIYNEGYTAPGQAYAIAKSMGYKQGGYPGWKNYVAGVDEVPAMLTPGEAVIPAPAAQDPMNKPMIDSMISQGRGMNRGMPMESPMEQGMGMQGPLSGKSKREQMKVMQDMSLKKKSWMADEKRKQEMHELKMEQTRQKGVLAMKQSQE